MWRPQESAGRKMLERRGAVLKGCMQIRLGQVTGVIGFGEQAQVGEPQISDQGLLDLQGGGLPLSSR